MIMRIQVGKSCIKDKKKYTYQDIEYDREGYADSKKYLPVEYDLCTLKTESKIINGWFSGVAWDGLKIKKGDKILYWKRID